MSALEKIIAVMSPSSSRGSSPVPGSSRPPSSPAACQSKPAPREKPVRAARLLRKSYAPEPDSDVEDISHSESEEEWVRDVDDSEEFEEEIAHVKKSRTILESEEQLAPVTSLEREEPRQTQMMKKMMTRRQEIEGLASKMTSGSRSEKFLPRMSQLIMLSGLQMRMTRTFSGGSLLPLCASRANTGVSSTGRSRTTSGRLCWRAMPWAFFGIYLDTWYLLVYIFYFSQSIYIDQHRCIFYKWCIISAIVAI